MENNNVNTVTLDLSRYNHLRDFETNITNGNTFVVNTGSSYIHYDVGGGRICSPQSDLKFISTDEAVKKIAEMNKKLQKNHEDILLKYNDIINNVKKELTVNEIKKLSIWKYLIWKYTK